MKNVFLDCGAMDGDVTARWMKTFADWDYYLFEADPCKADELGARFADCANVRVKHCAVWDEGDVLLLHRREKPCGSTFFADKTTGGEEVAIEPVPAVDFGVWVEDHLSESDCVVMKLNVEGAEYRVIRRMAEVGVLAWVDVLYVGWHACKVPSLRSEHARALRLLRESGVRWKEWRWPSPAGF